MEQQLQGRFNFEEPTDDGRSISTLIPILLLLTAALGIDHRYQFLRESVTPNTRWSTPSLWSPGAGYEDLLAGDRALGSHGAGEALTFLPKKPSEYLAMLAKPLPGVEPIASADWSKARYLFIPMLEALHCGRQLPREMLVQQAMAFCEGGKALAMVSEAARSSPKGGGSMQ
ncbi:hypothetical protein ACFX58_14705 [Sphingomonas sp. NCPPB 2930]